MRMQYLDYEMFRVDGMRNFELEPVDARLILADLH